LLWPGAGVDQNRGRCNLVRLAFLEMNLKRFGAINGPRPAVDPVLAPTLAPL